MAGETPVLYSDSKTVDDQRRILVDSSLIEASLKINVKKGEGIDLWGLVGNKKQIQILSPDSELAKMREEYRLGRGKWQVSWDSGANRDTDLMRRLGGLLGVACRHESTGKYRLTLPTLAVDLKLVKTESPIVIFVAGPLFELWQPESWVETVATPNVAELSKEIAEKSS